MASVSFTQFSLLPRINNWNLNGILIPCLNLVQIQYSGTNRKILTAVSNDKVTISTSVDDVKDAELATVEKKTRRTIKKASPRTRNKELVESSAVDPSLTDEEIIPSTRLDEGLKKTRTRAHKKVPSTSGSLVDAGTEKVTKRRKSKKKADELESIQENETETSDYEVDTFTVAMDEESEQELEFDIDDGEDISYTYGWPPLVCCFGAAQHAFVPWGRPANRLVDYEMLERRKDAVWEPERFVRASGGCSSNVAIALACLGGKVAFMGKLGDDAFGQSLLYHLNTNNVQTRSVNIDSKRATAISHMKIGKRSALRMTTIKPCAQDCLSIAEINIGVLKEAKMFYFNTSSLLDRNMRSTALQAVKISKKLGNVVFYDLNLPLPLWRSCDETKMFVRRAWNLSNIIEVTKQELEFLCGIVPTENFDTRNNDRSKFTHYSPEVVSQLWHDDLKVLFVTNGTSKIHYYTKEHNGAVHGMEDAPITPYTSDMSASGDGIVAGLMRMLTVQPHLISDKEYLERTIKYAISCGVIDQWLQARKLGFPAKQGMEDTVVSDPHGIKSISEREYRTLVPTTS